MIACGHKYINSESRIKLPKRCIKPAKIWKTNEILMENSSNFFSNICRNPEIKCRWAWLQWV